MQVTVIEGRRGRHHVMLTDLRPEDLSSLMEIAYHRSDLCHYFFVGKGGTFIEGSNSQSTLAVLTALHDELISYTEFKPDA